MLKASQEERRARTHARVLQAAGRKFRRHGYDGIGVAGVAKDAGLTIGALYDHFGSKDAVFAAAVAAGLDEVRAAIPSLQAAHGPAWLSVFCAYYLGRPHRDDRETGCAMAALTPEVARTDIALRAAFEERMGAIAKLIATGLPTVPEAARIERAWAILAALIGGVNLMRAMADDAASDAVAAGTRAAVLAMAAG